MGEGHVGRTQGSWRITESGYLIVYVYEILREEIKGEGKRDIGSARIR